MEEKITNRDLPSQNPTAVSTSPAKDTQQAGLVAEEPITRSVTNEPPDGGLKGQPTSDPAEVDAIIKRAWKAIHQGTPQDLNDLVTKFFQKNIILNAATMMMRLISFQV